jgi:hypothetical protein
VTEAEPDGATDDVLLSQRIERPQIQPYERRVRADGLLEEWSAVRVEFVEGETRFLDQQPQWRPVVMLSESDVEALEQVIAGVGFEELAGEHLPAGTSIGGSVVTWTATIDGRSYEVVLNGAPAVRLPEIDTMALRLEQIVAGAMDRRREEQERRPD